MGGTSVYCTSKALAPPQSHFKVCMSSIGVGGGGGGGAYPLCMVGRTLIAGLYTLLGFHTPPALRRLTEKARLLGYEVEVGVVGTDARRRIAPGLTVDFVNYFSGKCNRSVGYIIRK